MKIIFSGAVCGWWQACFDEAAMCGWPVAWCEPEELFLRADDPQVFSPDIRFVWVYMSPVDAVMAGADGISGSVESLLDAWLSRNRFALNLRRRLRGRLLFVDGSGATIRTICSALDVHDQGESSGEIAPTRKQASALDGILSGALGRHDSRYSEMLEALQAASWPVLANSPAIQDGDSAAQQLFWAMAEVQSSRRAAVERDGLEAAFRQHDVALQESKAVGEKKEAELSEAIKRQAQENELLLIQLHQVQEELECYYLRLKAIEHEGSSAAAAQSQAERQCAALRLQLGETQAELHRQVARQSDLSRVPSRVLVSTFARRLYVKLMPGPVRRFGANRELERTLGELRNSRWFNGEWYLVKYPDVEAAGFDAARHYHLHGWQEGRNPGPDFDSRYYLAANPDVKSGGMDPLLHFIRHGEGEGRTPSSTVGCGSD